MMTILPDTPEPKRLTELCPNISRGHGAAKTLEVTSLPALSAPAPKHTLMSEPRRRDHDNLTRLGKQQHWISWDHTPGPPEDKNIFWSSQISSRVGLKPSRYHQQRPGKSSEFWKPIFFPDGDTPAEFLRTMALNFIARPGSKPVAAGQSHHGRHPYIIHVLTRLNGGTRKSRKRFVPE